MSTLKIYRPADDSDLDDTPAPAASEAASDSDGPVLLSFASWVERLRGLPADLAERSRSMHANCQCPRCRHAAVVPLMLNDGRIDSAGQVVPGTATLVGFRCGDCEHEWPATSDSRPSAG